VSNTSQNKGVFYGIGVGPGDPELITLKAARLIQEADVITYLSNDKGESQARQIVETLLINDAEELPIIMPMRDDPRIGERVYDEAAVAIEAKLKRGLNVAFLCEGDPLFFGSFAYLLARIEGHFDCVSVPGISSPHAASSVLNLPLTMMKESFCVISGRHDDAFIENALLSFDSLIIMKAGRSRSRLLTLLASAKRTEDAQYLEYIGRENQLIVSDLSNLSPNESGPYFSLFIVTRRTEHKNGRRV